MSRSNNPFACLAGNSGETDPECLARQQRKSNRNQSQPDTSRCVARSPFSSNSHPGRSVTTQLQASLHSDHQNNPDSSMDAELLAALQESLLTAPDGAVDPDILAAAVDKYTASSQGRLPIGLHQPAMTQDRPLASPFTIHNNSNQSAQFPPLPGSSTSSSQPLSPQTQRSASSSGSMWESFTAVFDTWPAEEPASSSPVPAQASEGDLPWALVGSPDTVSRLAAATGLSEQELLLAQQTALLEEASKKRTGHNSTTGTYKAAAATNSSRRPTYTPSTAATAGRQESFPALVSSSSSSSCAGSPLLVGRSPLSLPDGWKGGRLKPRGSAVKVLNRGDNSSGQQAAAYRPGKLDLHWDLQLDGLRLKEDDADWELAEVSSLGGLHIAEDEAADAATRKLVEQQSAEAEATAGRASSGSGGNDKYSKQAVWMQLSRAGRQAGSSQADAASSHGLLEPDGEGDQQQQHARCGARSFVGAMNWRSLLIAVKEHGWEPVDKRDGGGGTHIKFRRVLLLPNGREYVQTNVLPSTPGDKVRAIRHVAVSFEQKELEKQQLLAGASSVT